MILELKSVNSTKLYFTAYPRLFINKLWYTKILKVYRKLTEKQERCEITFKYGLSDKNYF